MGLKAINLYGINDYETHDQMHKWRIEALALATKYAESGDNEFSEAWEKVGAALSSALVEILKTP
jgi:hypothetical protein